MSESHLKLSSFFVVNPTDEYYGQECRLEPPTSGELNEGIVVAKFPDGIERKYTNGQRSGRMPEIAHLGTSASHGLSHVRDNLEAVREAMTPLYAETAPKDWTTFHTIMSRVLDAEPIVPEIDDRER